MRQSKTQLHPRSLFALAHALTLCAVAIVPCATAQSTNKSLSMITSLQFDLPSAGKIPINGVALGSGRPSVFMGGTPLIVNDGFQQHINRGDLSSLGE